MLIKFFESFSYKFVDHGNSLRYILRHCQVGAGSGEIPPGNSMWANGLHGVSLSSSWQFNDSLPTAYLLDCLPLLGLK
jgi:hypothetical protein